MTQEYSDPEEIIGTFIGNYKIMDLLGSGAFGDVFLGRHPSIEREVAIKVLDGFLSRDPEIVQRFKDEARSVNIIKHPNIIQIFDFGQLDDGRQYFIMELLHGIELGELIEEKGNLSVRETMIIAKQVLSGLDVAHKLGIIHRDLKPDNIFVSMKGNFPEIKILDFGIAKLLGEAAQSKASTGRGLVMGTPLYMSPEQASGSIEEIAPPSDLYSFGVIMFKMLSGQYPINAETPRKLLFKQVSEPPLKLFDLTRGIPEKFCNVIDRTLEKEPEKRPQSAMELYDELKKAAALISPELIKELTDLDEAQKFNLELEEARKTLEPEFEDPEYIKPDDNKGSILFYLLLLIMFLLALGAGFAIWQRVVYFLNKNQQGTVQFNLLSGKDTEPKDRVVKKTTQPKKQKISVWTLELKSRQTGVKADLFVNGRLIKNKTSLPVSVKIKNGAKVSLQAYKEGYEVQKQSFKIDGDIEITLTWKKQ
ncbi:MAG: serine/threonine-protein kinase [Deltaproteobacteria bacterium]|jgi:serine/threonine protein kinase|nr:serine/threonine-protein kinase [Deltaproteobacteria bacterium]